MFELRVFLAGLALLAGFWGCDGHTYHLGGCPNIEPMPAFSMKKMLGIWYVVQKTSTASTCITYNFTETEEPGEYLLEQTSQHFVLGLTPLKHEYHYTGRLSIPDDAVPGRMKVRFPLSVAGSASYTVFMTDYDTYAGIFTCQKLGFAHRQSATILSREKTLEQIYIDKIRSKLAAANIDPFDLSIISQKNCPKGENGTNINIDDETFSAHSVAGVIKKAGEKIGDGVEYVAGGAKKVYNKVAENIGDDKDEKSKLVTINPNAEWLP
ncbi:apolipoprotein D [Tribolium castaneum]|uniref:Apolipoprotein D-like Protein n=1 Tax=Tribolium castaneum TaxID=7070 RepID=D2A5L9_TRICA|nr:PREDICTED: apolipoprotein D [Tribolium castaneum]EFA05391.1 Apolipoprotein D-like Protein [Tribolium castaneum]|eukprot:XP_971031.1 PREDICTED: apolipoprotein D [Tribolium castaneum]